MSLLKFGGTNLYRTIVTVYTDNIFIYNYLQQMNQIIQLSPVGSFTPTRGKSMQKNCEVSDVNERPSNSICIENVAHSTPFV